MEEQYRQWRRNAIEERALAYTGGGSGDRISTQGLAAFESRLTYDDFKASVMQGDDGGRLLNYVNANVIFQAGVDFESKPIVVFCACSLPSPREVDYDRLLNLIIFRLDEFVESDYTVVMFTSGAQHNPGWNWMTKAYRRLDRKYRKNVKNVYVVHPSMWSKLVFQIFGKIVSPKFFAKVTWVDTLSQLATLVPMNQINIPQPVYEYNMKVEQSITLPSEGLGAHRNHYPHQRSQQQQQDFGESPVTQVYGMSLEHLMNQQGRRVLPRPIRECLVFIGHHGLSTEGLFRRSPPSTALRSAKDSYNHDQAVDLSLAGVHVAAVLLKLFFRELPEPVFSNHNYSLVRALPASIPLAAATASQDPSSETVEIAKQMDHVRARYVEEVILPSLKPEYRLLLCFTFGLLQMVARNEKTNRMTAYNLAIVWAPNLARSSNPVLDVTMCVAGPAAPTVGSVVQIMVQMYDKVFRREIGLILGGQAGQVVDPAMEVIRIADRMNTGEIIGLKSPSPALPPRPKSPTLPPRVKSPALPPRVKSPMNELAPDLPPRILSPGLSPSARSPSADSVESVQVFADAESASLPPLSANMEVSGSEGVSVEPALAEEPVESVESVEKNEAITVSDTVMPEAMADKPIDVKSDELAVKPIDTPLQLSNFPETISDQRVDASASAAVESK